LKVRAVALVQVRFDFWVFNRSLFRFFSWNHVEVTA
jgi:hypothetical protein